MIGWLVGSWYVNFTISGTSFVGVSATMQDYIVYIVNVYAPCSLVDKHRAWEEMKVL